VTTKLKKSTERGGMIKKTENEFERIRRMFYPRWDLKRAWKIKVGFRVKGCDPNHCFCDKDNLTIWISPNVAKGKGPYSLAYVLVHEICHAITTGEHKKLFFDRMRRNLEIAIRLGETEIADEINKFEFELPSENISTPDYVYWAVRSMVSDAPRASFQRVVSDLASERGLNKEEFLKKYHRVKSVFNETKRSMGHILANTG
jgi:hypothetical protein